MVDKKIIEKKKLRDILSKFYKTRREHLEDAKELDLDTKEEFEKAKISYKSLMQVHEDLKRGYEDFLKKMR